MLYICTIETSHNLLYIVLDTVLSSDNKDIWSLLCLFERRMTYSAGRCLHSIGRTLNVSATKLSNSFIPFLFLSLFFFSSFSLSLSFFLHLLPTLPSSLS